MCFSLGTFFRSLWGTDTGGRSLVKTTPSNAVRRECQGFILTTIQLDNVMEDMALAVFSGLKKRTNETSPVKCYPTFVQTLPDGTERGKFLALDLGGTNFRILLIDLEGEREYSMKSDIYKVPVEIQTGTGIALFDHIASCISEFIKKNKIDTEEPLPLGFTFSFPLKQEGLDKGYLIKWTKGFNCSGVVGEDVVQLLKDAINRRDDVNVDVVAILNDTTGTIMSCAWRNPETKIGLIVGTGCNACYVEQVVEAELFENKGNKDKVIINTEWGAFGEDGELDLIYTRYDSKIDELSSNPGKQRFEKMVSGMYMGEIVRMIIERLTIKKVLFDGEITEQIQTEGAFSSSYISDVENDKGNNRNIKTVLGKMGIKNPTELDCVNVHYICKCVSTRSAQLIGAGLASLINKMEEHNVTVAIDGSVYRYHPFFHVRMFQETRRQTDDYIEFDFMLSEDGSGRGAALVAAVALREALERTLDGVFVYRNPEEIRLFLLENGEASSFDSNSSLDSVLAPLDYEHESREI